MVCWPCDSVSPSHSLEPPPLPVTTWPQRPILVECRRERESRVLLANSEEAVEWLAKDWGVTFKCFVKEAPLSTEYFQGRNRRVGIIIRLRPHQRVCFSDLLNGSSFASPLRVPPQPLRGIILALFRLAVPKVPLKSVPPECKSSESHADRPSPPSPPPPRKLELRLGAKPSVYAPAICEAKKLAVRRVGAGVPLENGVREDTAALGGYFSEAERSSVERRAYFGKRKHRDCFHFEPGYEYDFEFYQHTLSFATYKLDLPIGGSVDVGRILRGQPMQFTLKLRRQQLPITAVLFWSEALLKHAA